MTATAAGIAAIGGNFGRQPAPNSEKDRERFKVNCSRVFFASGLLKAKRLGIRFR